MTRDGDDAPAAATASRPGVVARSEWRWVGAVSAICLLATILPLVYALCVTPPGKVFLWNNRLDAQDLYTYLSWMDQGARGNLLFRDRFTTESHDRVLFLPLFLVGGWISRLSGLSPPVTYHAFRVLLSAVLLVIAYHWIARLHADVGTRRVALLLVAFSSGLGWLARRWDLPSTDLGIPESITFMSLYQSPLFVASLACMLVIFRGAPGPSQKPTPGRMAAPTGASFALAWIHPYDVVTVLVVGAAWTVLVSLRRRGDGGRDRRGAAIWLSCVTAGALPAIAYNGWITLAEPVFRGWAQMVHAPSPSPLGYGFGFGLLLPLAAFGARDFLRGSDDRRLLPLVWIVAAALLVYAPASFQRRLVHGAHLPLCVLAASGVSRLRAWIAARARAVARRDRLPRGVLAAAAALLLSASNIWMISENVKAYRSGVAPYYLRREYLDAFRWLRESTWPDHAVLSSLATGSFIPGIAGNTVYVGHWGLTLSVHEKKATVEGFFETDQRDEEKQAFLRAMGIVYLFHGEIERRLGPYSPESKPYLERVYGNRLVSIYRYSGAT